MVAESAAIVGAKRKARNESPSSSIKANHAKCASDSNVLGAIHSLILARVNHCPSEGRKDCSMNNLKTVVKVDKSKEIRDRLTVLADKATGADKSKAKEIHELACSGKRHVGLYSLSPAVCAILFLTQNGHNRDFNPIWAEELKRRMIGGLWKPNNATIGFYVDGDICDGQHRLAAAALANQFLSDYAIVFGNERDSIDTVDSPKVRDGASHAQLDGIKSASIKQTIVKGYAAYMQKVKEDGDPSFALKSASEVKSAIESNNQLLDGCIRIAEESTRNRVGPTMKVPQAATAAYIMLKNG